MLFTDPKTEKRVLEITKCTVIAVRNLQSEYDSHRALAEVSILIPSDDARGGDKLGRTRSRWSWDNWNRPDLNSQPVTQRGAPGTRARGRHKLRVNESFVSWPRWALSGVAAPGHHCEDLQEWLHSASGQSSNIWRRGHRGFIACPSLRQD